MKAKSVLTSVIVISLFLLQLTFAALPRYEITDLGTLGGYSSCAYSINSSGQIVGMAANSSNCVRATLFDPTGKGNNIDLGTIGGCCGVARSINDCGQIVGWSSDNSTGWSKATLFDPTGNGNNVDLGSLGVGLSGAYSVNNSGHIVGYAFNSSSYRERATLFDPTGNGENIDLSTPDGSWSEVAYSINDKAQIVGKAQKSADYVCATLFDPNGSGNNIDLGTLGGSHSAAHSINDTGQIVGIAENSSGYDHATLFDPSGNADNTDLGILDVVSVSTTSLMKRNAQITHSPDSINVIIVRPELPKYPAAKAFCINDNGQIVGYYREALAPYKATLFDPTGNSNNLDLNTLLIDPNCGWTLEYAYSINNSGWIVGQGMNSAGEHHAYLLIPKPPKIIYVDDDAAGANDGSSWADAFNYLQDALTAAWSGDEIRVGKGIYTPDSNSTDPNGSGDREATFQLINGVTIKGGYAGFGEPDPNARDIEENRTILSGDLAGDDGYDLANRKENSYHIVTGSGTDATAVLDGFYIRRGHANRQEDPWGAGMYNDHGSPIVKNCAFVSNYANAEQRSMGGGMYNYYSSPALINCRFIGNCADVTDKNRAGGNGAGMCNYFSSPTLTNCTIWANDARDYGGGMYNIDSNPTLIYSTLQSNRAFLDGGGIYNCRSTLKLTKCMFIENWVYGSNNGSNNGGAMYSDASDTTLTNCTLTRNGATNGSSLACDSPGQLHPSSVQMTNCIFWDYGNEIWNNDNSSVIITYSDVQSGWPGEGNISADPLFVNPGGVENFRLAESSPCIDTGDPNYIPEPNETDFDGFPRIVGGRIDMGVYEFQGRLILYVDNDAPGSDDGSSWVNAYNCLQDALIPADPTGGPVEIRVAEGIYKPDQGAAVMPGDREVSFRIKPRVTVKGGYAGFGEPDPNARDTKLYETILSGDLAGDDGPKFENNDENSYNVVRGGALGETTILDGFTITGGNANGSKFFNKQGGGIRVFPDITFTIKNCTIIRNRAEYYGGGIHSSGSSGCCFPIINCRFIANSAGGRGGAISLDGESLPRITSCVFAGNSADAGGAIGNIEGYPRIKNCTFTGNRALDECDAVIDYDGEGFENCILWANTGQSPQLTPDCYGGYYSCIQGWTGALGGIGNINEDPLFVDPGYWDPKGMWVDGDYHLLLGSPCIDAGDPNYVADPNETDLDGNPRIINGRIDMGAFEYRPLIPAEARILPRTINLASKGNWITCYIWLPEGYDVADIDPNSVFLEEQIKAEPFSVNEQQQVATAKFIREDVQAILEVGEIELTITGQLADGTVFEGTDTIKVIDKAGSKSAKQQ